jgi:hypothetical protein
MPNVIGNLRPSSLLNFMSSFISNTADDVAIATIRTLAVDVVGKANSGHPGLSYCYFLQNLMLINPMNLGAPMGMAPVAHVLFSRYVADFLVLNRSCIQPLFQRPGSSMPTPKILNGLIAIDSFYLTG